MAWWGGARAGRLRGDRGLERSLGLAGRPFVKVNPKQARRFAQAIGRLAKTDNVDARMLARMGLELDLAPQEVEGEDVHDLRGLLRARRASIRRAIYMPALVAIRFNQDLGDTFQALPKNGKPEKVVVTAVMRRIVVLANTLLHEGRDWQPNRT